MQDDFSKAVSCRDVGRHREDHLLALELDLERRRPTPLAECQAACGCRRYVDLIVVLRHVTCSTQFT
jgi:hypothetical protein